MLSRAYEQAMYRIQNQKDGFRALAERALSWIVCAKRQLTTTELQHAMATEIGEQEFDRDNIPEAEDLVMVCAGLVTIDKHTGIIRLVHYTLQEYFESAWDAWFPDAHCEIAKVCITYLSFRAFHPGWCPTDKHFKARLRRYPLYDYAARFWGKHAYPHSDDIKRLVLKFLRMEPNVAAANQAMMASPKYRYDGYSQKVPKRMNGMHVTAYFGLTEVLFALRNESLDLNSKDSYGNTPILWAASRGHAALVQMLLETPGVDPDLAARNNCTPLLWAAWKGHDAVVKAFLEDGRADVNVKNRHGRTPLSLAAKHGHEAVVKLLLPLDQIDTLSKDKRGRDAIGLAIRFQHWDVAKLLIGREDIKTAMLEFRQAKAREATDDLAN